MANVSTVQDKVTTGAPAKLIIRDIKRINVFSSTIPPREMTYNGFESSYNEVQRPDRKPILQRLARNLRGMSATLFIGSNDMFDSTVNQKLITLEALAASIHPIIVEYDNRTYGYWRIVSLSYDSVLRDPISNDITRANASIEFREVVESKNSSTLNTVYGSGGLKRPSKVTSPKGGTSLINIAVKYYGTDSKYIVAAIAKASNIKNPSHVPPGKKITLP